MHTELRLLLLGSLLGASTLVGCEAAASEAELDHDLGLEVEQNEAALSWDLAPGKGAARHRLIAWAALPHETRTPGPTSGQFINPAHGVTPPFDDAQPVPGWSGLLPNRDGSFLAMPDNGFGSKGNSSDYVLGVYTIRPRFKTRADGTSAPGSVSNEAFTAFRDPNGLLRNGAGVDLTITADRATYFRGDGNGTDTGIQVDAAILSGRLLTGYDFDVESIARAKDGTLWVGEEFGPYLLHFAADGTLLDEPVPHPYLKSPNHPDVLAGKTPATLASSRGFESLAFDARKKLLYAVPEGAPTVDALRPVAGDERVVEIFEFDPAQGAYTGRAFKYRKDGDTTSNAIVIGDMANLGGDIYVLIERDSLYGANAVVKRLYLVDLNVADTNGVLHKRLLVDLLDIEDPRDLGGDLPGLAPDTFNMPFDSIECVHPVDPFTLAVAIDTNYPTEDGRTVGTPDSSEIIELRFPLPLALYAPKKR
ncbi:MAG: esterase-like activity of phytase family protein [Polyangiales bacterium]